MPKVGRAKFQLRAALNAPGPFEYCHRRARIQAARAWPSNSKYQTEYAANAKGKLDLLDLQKKFACS